MSQSPTRRRGHRPAGARARQAPADAHEGAPREFLCRHGLEAREAASDPRLREVLLPKLIGRVADQRNLRLAIDHVAMNGDRWLRNLDPDEKWQLARVLGTSILDGSYRPGPGRKRKLPKTSGKGFRTLTKPDSVDRVVERAVVQILQPILNPLFFDSSFGYRPGLGRTDALAYAESLARSRDSWVWIAEDCEAAFDRVSQRRLLDVVRHHAPDDRIVQLVELLVVTKSGKGLKQGGPLSPLLLNLYLHHHLDQVWRSQHPDVPLIRVADDVLVLCNTEQEASEMYAALKQIVEDCGMSLKGTPQSSIRNLSAGETVAWLGYELRTDGARLRVSLTDRTWRSLERRMKDCHEKPDPPVRAVEVIRGWVGQLGPTYPTADHSQVYAEVIRAGYEHGFEELPSYEEVLEWWEAAHAKWERKRRRAAGARARLPRGSARAEVSRADTGPLPGGPPERGGPPGTSSIVEYWISIGVRCPADGGPGSWTYLLGVDGREVVSTRSGSSPHTTRERMEILALLRGLEAVPPGSRVRLLLADCGVGGRVAALCRGGDGGEDPEGAGAAGRSADLWRRLGAAVSAYEVSADPGRGGAAGAGGNR